MILTLLYKDCRVIVAAIESITRVYKTNVVPRPLKVPFGMDLLGVLRSPDMLDPLHIISLK